VIFIERILHKHNNRWGHGVGREEGDRQERGRERGREEALATKEREDSTNRNCSNEREAEK